MPSPKRSLRAFSLVEVTIAIGITAFCLVPIVGMLPVGLRSMKNANEQAAAAAIVSQIAATIRGAASTNGQDYVASFGGGSGSSGSKEVRYSIGSASSQSQNLGELTISGAPASGDFEKRFATAVTILAPASASEPGKAVISVAWPAAANPRWNDAKTKWDGNVEGSLTTAIQFIPRS